MGDNMKFNEVMNELKSLGTDQAIKIYKNHGADIDLFGVSIANLKKLYKKIKVDHELGLELLNSSNVDAMYLSQWVVEPDKLTIDELEKVLHLTDYYMIIDNVVANLAAKNKDAITILHKWIDHENHRFRQAAYSLFTLILMTFDNKRINIDFVKEKLDYVKKNIHNEQNRVRYSMNSFLIGAGIYLEQFTDLVKDYAKEIGKVNVSMGKTSCKVPDAYTYIQKVEKMNKIGIKRKL